MLAAHKSVLCSKVDFETLQGDDLAAHNSKWETSQWERFQASLQQLCFYVCTCPLQVCLYPNCLNSASFGSSISTLDPYCVPDRSESRRFLVRL